MNIVQLFVINGCVYVISEFAGLILVDDEFTSDKAISCFCAYILNERIPEFPSPDIDTIIHSNGYDINLDLYIALACTEI